MARGLPETKIIMMFALEKEMIPVLKRDLPLLFGHVHTEEEFVCGVGRPDLVFATIAQEMDRVLALPDYQAIHLLIRYLNKEGKTVHIDRILGLAIFPKKRVLTILDSLIALGFIELNDGEYSFKKAYTPLVQDFVSIEAKLSNWKEGLYQAVRYQTFSDRAYLAIAEEHLNRVDQKQLREYGVGLISVSRTGARLILLAKKNKPRDFISRQYLSEAFCVKNGLALSAI